jgi:hypothetical protein
MKNMRKLILLAVLGLMLLGYGARRLYAPPLSGLFVLNGSTFTVTNGAVIDSSGSVVFNGGLLDASGATPGSIRLTGDWNRDETSVFVPGTSTVTFYNVRPSSITGNSTFYVLASTEAGKTIYFQQGSTQTLLNVLGLGNTSLGNEVKLRSSEDGQVWSFNVMNGSRTVHFLDVKDALAIGNLIKACDSVDSGNNVNWLFPGSLSILLNSNTYDFGAVPIGGSSQTVTAIIVTNNGCAAETYTLRATTATPGTQWLVGADTNTAPGHNTFLVRAAFHGVQPSTGPSNQFGGEDVVNLSEQSSTGQKYTIDGSQTGAAVPAENTRNLWFFLQMPLTTSTTWQQQINAIITATP